MCAIVHAADIQDRDGGVLLMSTLFGMFPFLLRLYADGGYQGKKFQEGLRHVCRQISLEIVKRSDAGKFVSAFATTYASGLDVFRKRQGMRSSILLWGCRPGWP